MPRLSRQCSGLAIVGALTASLAHAQFTDDFDSYAAGTQLQGINGWRGWANTPAAAGAVDNTLSASAPNSIAIGPAGDAVNDLGNPTTGCWRFSADTFVPSGGAGEQYLILLNTYADAGPYNWSVQLKMNLTTGLITDDFDVSWPGAPVPLDSWFTFQLDIDLDNDLCAIRIDLNGDGHFDDNGADDVLGTADDELISSGQSWSGRGSGGGAVAIGAVDLFSNGASTIYYDNVSLEACPPGFFDDFDAYAVGTPLQGINGWRGWANTPAAAGVVSNAVFSTGPNAIAIGPAGDAVNDLGNPTTGCWRFSVDSFVPSGGAGDQYLILLNTYADAGPYNWSVQLKMNLTTGLITDDFDPSWPGAPVPLDCWFKFQLDIDLDNDRCSIWIDLNCDGFMDDNGADNIAGTADDELISSGQSWSSRGSGGGAVAIGAVDLFSNGASTMYYDNVSLQECPPGFFDNFDAYALGTPLDGINGWKGWANSPAAVGVVSSAQAASAPHAIAIGPAGDAVNELGKPSTGCWRFSVDSFVPSGSAGDQYLILLNTYNDAGPYNWSVQLKMNLTTGLITDDFDASWAGAPVPLDCWFEFQIDIDLDNDLCSIRIDLNCDGVLDDDGADNLVGTADDELISAGQSWSNRGSGGGDVAIGAVDLFSNGASTIYYDNVSLQQCPPSFIAMSYCGPASANSTGGPAVMTATGSRSFGASDLAFQVTGVPMNSYGYILMGTATDNVIPSGSVGTLCVGGTIERGIGNLVLFSGASNTVSVSADVNMLTPSGAYVLPGDTRYFQYWYRDLGPSSNLSNGLRLSFH